jgi:hypothetical protein
MLILLIEFLLDPGELSLDGVLLLLNRSDLLIQLILSLLTLLQLVLDVTRTLRLTHLALQEHDLVVQGFLLLLGDVGCQQSVLELVQLLAEVLTTAVEGSSVFL